MVLVLMRLLDHDRLRLGLVEDELVICGRLGGGFPQHIVGGLKLS